GRALDLRNIEDLAAQRARAAGATRHGRRSVGGADVEHGRNLTRIPLILNRRVGKGAPFRRAVPTRAAPPSALTRSTRRAQSPDPAAPLPTLQFYGLSRFRISLSLMRATARPGTTDPTPAPSRRRGRRCRRRAFSHAAQHRFVVLAQQA